VSLLVKRTLSVIRCTSEMESFSGTTAIALPILTCTSKLSVNTSVYKGLTQSVNRNKRQLILKLIRPFRRIGILEFLPHHLMHGIKKSYRIHIVFPELKIQSWEDQYLDRSALSNIVENLPSDLIKIGLPPNGH